MATRRHLLLGTAPLWLCVLVPHVLAQAKERRIGYLAPGPRVSSGVYDQFVARLRELGRVEGRGLAIEYREIPAPEAANATAEALVRSRVDVIVAQSPLALAAARHATVTIPIVAFFIVDPVRMGVARTLREPGGNVTGFTWDQGVEGIGKPLEVLRELVPRNGRVAMLWNAGNDANPYYVQEAQARAGALGLEILSLAVQRAEDIEPAFRRLVDEKAGSVVLFSDPFMIRQRDMLTVLLARYPVPAVWGSTAWPLKGAAVIYAANVDDQPRRAAEYADRILKGASPATLPFQQPTKEDLIIDAGVVAALGLAVPPSLRARASRIVGP